MGLCEPTPGMLPWQRAGLPGPKTTLDACIYIGRNQVNVPTELGNSYASISMLNLYSTFKMRQLNFLTRKMLSIIFKTTLNKNSKIRCYDFVILISLKVRSSISLFRI